MEINIYNQVKNNIKEFIVPLIEEFNDSYLIDNEDRIVERFTQEICNTNNKKMISCTEKETEAYRKLMGLDNDGKKRSFREVELELNKHNARALILNANRKLIWSIYREILFEDKTKIIQMNYQYKKNKGMIFPEDIEIENLKSIIYFEYKDLKEKGINNVKDLTNYEIPEIKRIINAISQKSKRKNKKNIASDLIRAIHIFGFLFKGEDGYDSQQEYLKRIKNVINSKVENDKANNNIIKELNNRKKELFFYTRLQTEKPLPFRNQEEIDKELEEVTNNIIKIESNILSKK